MELSDQSCSCGLWGDDQNCSGALRLRLATRVKPDRMHGQMVKSFTLLSLLILLVAADAPPASSPDQQLTAAAKEAAAISKTFDDELHAAKHDMPLVTAAN